MEEEIIEELMKECNISEGLSKLLIKICNDNNVDKNIIVDILKLM